MGILNEYLDLAGDALNVVVGQGTGLLGLRVEQYALVGDEIAATLRNNEERQAAEFAELLGSRAHAVAHYLRTHDGRAIWSDAQDVFNGRGWVMAGAGLVAGFLAARAIRSTPPSTYGA